MMESNARVSSSTNPKSKSFIFCPFSAHGENSSTRSSQPRFTALKLATIVPSEAPSAPANALILPPPGAIESLAVSWAKLATVIETNLESFGSFSKYSMIRVWGSKSLNSFKPMLLMAISMRVASLTPLLNPCFSRKYFPASNIGCKGTKPTSSLPVTRTPRSSADFRVSSNTM